MVANLVQIQDKLKDLSDDQLRSAYSQGTVPQFMVMTEMGRRKEMKEEYQKNQAQGSTTVAEDILAPAANMARGLGAMAQPQNRMDTQPQNLPVEQSMATMPPSPQPMANKLPVTRMANGGLAKIKARDGMSLGYDPNLGRIFTGQGEDRRFNPEAFREAYLGQLPADQQNRSSVRRGLLAGSDVGKGTYYVPRVGIESLFPRSTYYGTSAGIDRGALNRAINQVSDLYKSPPEENAGKKTNEFLEKLKSLRAARLSAGNAPSGAVVPAVAATSTTVPATSTTVPATSTTVPAPKKPVRMPIPSTIPSQVSASGPVYTDVPLEAGKEAAARIYTEQVAADAAAAAADAAKRRELAAAELAAENAARLRNAAALSGAAPDASGLAALSTEIGNVASRNYQADANLIPSSLTARQADVTKFLGAINPSAASAYAGFQTKLKARGEGIEEARDEAQGFALIEAALRIAGSKGATIGEAVSDAAPALASYQKSASSLRKEEALIMGEEMKLAQLQEAEKAGRKAEAASLRKELGDIGANIRSIKVEDKKLFNQSKQADIAVLSARVTVANAKTDAEYKKELVRLKNAENNRESISAENIANRANVEIGTLTNRLQTETDPVKRQLIGDQIRNQKQIKQNATATAQAFTKYDPYKKATAASQVRANIVNMLKQRGAALTAKSQMQKELIAATPQERQKRIKEFDDNLAKIDKQITAANNTLRSIQDGSYTASGGNRTVITQEQIDAQRQRSR